MGMHYTDEEHYEEAASLAIILVSCDVDHEVKCISRMAERQTTSTPDYVADLFDGRTVRIEVTNFVDQEAMDYQNYWLAVFKPLRKAIRADSVLSAKLKGKHLLFHFPNGAPKYEIAKTVGDELLELLRTCDVDLELLPRMAIPARFRCLGYFGGSYSIQKRDNAEGTVSFDLPHFISDADRILDSVKRGFEKKTSKHEGYSDDGAVPVWLAAFARDEAGGTNLTALYDLKSNAQNIVVDPFERFMVANTVAGLRVDADRSKPAVFRSLTVPYCEIPRQ